MIKTYFLILIFFIFYFEITLFIRKELDIDKNVKNFKFKFLLFI